MDRVIFHCDLNNFYASVELLDHPELKYLPVAVCGNPSSRHGIILAKNEPAKAAGVQTAETIFQAREKCPALVLLPAHHEKYIHFSHLANRIYQEYSDRVEMFGIDESWLDVTGTLHLFGSDAVALADRLRERIREELGLTLSIGVSFNKVFAKLGSDYKKPDATTLITPENFRQLVWPLPVTDLLFVGRTAAKVLARCNIYTIGQLAHADWTTLQLMLGKQGPQLKEYAQGLDHAPVAPAGYCPPPKSVGNGLTFPRNLLGEREVRTGVALLADQVSTRLRKHGLKCTTVQVVIRDPQFKDLHHQRRLSVPTFLSSELVDTAIELISQRWSWRLPIRALTLTAAGLIPEVETGEQLNLFYPNSSGHRQRLEHLEKTVDSIRNRYGSAAIGRASLLDPTLKYTTPTPTAISELSNRRKYT